MNKNNAAAFLPLVQALTEGRALQRETSLRDWVDIEDISFNEAPCKYRIKAEPTMRPWKPDEVPLGAHVRLKQEVPTQADIIDSYVVRKDEQYNFSIRTTINGLQTARSLFNAFEWRGNNQCPWQPCGVLE